jgi:hypothetical protein
MNLKRNHEALKFVKLKFLIYLQTKNKQINFMLNIKLIINRPIAKKIWIHGHLVMV